MRRILLFLALAAGLTGSHSMARAQAAPPPAPGTPTRSDYGADGLSGFDVMTATVFQQGQSSFSGLAMRFRLHDSSVMDPLEVLPTIEYWRNNSSIGDLRLKRSDATLGADARWLFPGKTWRFYAGGGVAIHYLSNEFQDANTLEQESLAKGGLTLLTGLTLAQRQRYTNFLELKAHLVGGYRQLKLNMGLSWNH